MPLLQKAPLVSSHLQLRLLRNFLKYLYLSIRVYVDKNDYLSRNGTCCSPIYPPILHDNASTTSNYSLSSHKLISSNPSLHHSFLPILYSEVEKYRPVYIALGPVIAVLCLLCVYGLRRKWCHNTEGRLKCKSRTCSC